MSHPATNTSSDQSSSGMASNSGAQNLVVSSTATIPQKQLRTFFPPIQPYSTGRIQVSPIHELYYEQVGNPQGNPVVFLHGGPGGRFLQVVVYFITGSCAD
jgi:hypothetical protein